MPGFLAPLLLFGLAAVSIPPIIHLLNRRRFEVVDWGAMQFLKISETTRRRLLIEEILLMALRMLLIAVMVLAMATPFITTEILPGAGAKPNRDVVLIFDGSASMGYTGTGKSAQDAAKEWATEFVNDLSAGDSVVILQAKQQVVPIIGEPTHDLERVRAAIDALPTPSGGADFPAAIEAARKSLLDKSQRPHRDIILLTDNQKHGWADDTALLGWGVLSTKVRDERNPLKPRVAVVNVAGSRPDDPPNWSLAPLETSRAVAGKDREITFKTALLLRGQTDYRPPYKVRLEIDGKPERELTAPTAAKLVKGQVPLTFPYKFSTAGSHLVSVIIEPDMPADKRPPGYVVKDHLPTDNRQNLAIEVVTALPVLIVDGEDRKSTDPKARDRGTDFMRKALMPAGEPPVVRVEVLPLQRFQSDSLRKDIGKEAGSKPRVLILFNVPQLTQPQQDAVTQFLADGGGVLVTLGDRVDARHFNEKLHRGGEGWLPTTIGEIDGDEVEPSRAAAPLPASFFHPALELFRREDIGGLGTARFPRWWKVAAPGRGSSSLMVAQLTTKDPLMVERPYRNGRILLCTVPLDDSWRTNLTRMPAFPPLVHELVYYLAGASSSRYNLRPGQAIYYQPAGDEPPGTVVVHPPQGDPKTIHVDRWPFEYADTREVGVYRVETGGKTIYYVVQSDPRESVLTPATEEDRTRVNELVAMKYYGGDEREKLNLELATSEQRQELWLWFLIGVIALLCGEVFMTRRIALSR